MSTQKGRVAEIAAANYLKQHGFTVLDTNWRTRWCEIDIIASKDGRIYFVEVKYRSSTAYGLGLEYITPKKLQQMHFAADFWLSRHNNGYAETTLAAIEVLGADYHINELVAID